MHRTVLAATFVVCLGACSTVVKEDAISLATNGRAAAAAGQSFLAIPGEQNAVFMDGVAFASAYPLPAPGVTTCNAGLTPIGDAERQLSQQYLDELAHARSFFTTLDETYAGFATLVNYDAEAGFNAGYGKLITAAGEYTGKPVTSGPALAVGGVLAWAQADAHNRRIREASANIREVLEAVRPEFSGRVRSFTGYRRVQLTQGYLVAQTIWCLGLADARPVITGLATPYGLEIAGKDPIRPGEGGMTAGINSVLNERGQRAYSSVLAAFEDIDKALAELIIQHENLEKGEAVDGAALAALITRIKAIIELYVGEE